MNYRFESIQDLENLPFYSLNKKNEIILKKGVIDYKIIDFHTHLGWNYPVGKKLDLWKKSAVNYCFPKNAPIDLSRHGALDFGEKLNHKEKEIISGILDLKEYSNTYTIPNIISEMDSLNVSKSIILCLKAPMMANNTNNIIKSVSQDLSIKNGLIVFASINPKTIIKKNKLKKWVNLGVKGLKLHPLFNFFRPNTKGCYKIYEQAKIYKLPVIFHTGLSPAAPNYLKKFVNIEYFEQVIKDFPEVVFILGHGGGFSDWEKVIEISQKYENVYLETSGQPPSVILEFIKKTDNSRILYGSDWPFYPMALSLTKVLLATDNNKIAREKILNKNAAKLLHYTA